MKEKHALILLLSVILVGFFAVLRFASAADMGTGASISNASPVFTVTPSDSGSYNGAGEGNTAGNPTNAGSNVTFTARANDVNSDQYYLAICRTDEIAQGDDSAPTCPGGNWAISAATDSTELASVTYTALSGDAESNSWYAFVCDKLPIASSPSCHPDVGAYGSDQGRAIGGISFSNIPDDEDSVTIDSVQYRFDRGGNGCVGAGTCVNISANQGAADTAISLAAAEAGVNSHMAARNNIVYVYANNSGVSGNAIAMFIGTCANCSLSGANLSGGSDANASPFYMNHAGTFGALSATDTLGGTIEPGDTVRFTIAEANLDDNDTNGGQDTLSMYICSGDVSMGGVTTDFVYGTTTCTGGTLLCSVTGVNPTSQNAACNDSQDIVAIPTAHGSYNVKVYLYDNHGLAYTGTTIQSFAVQDVIPFLGAYVATDSPAPTAGGSDTVDFTVALADNNGDNDVTIVEGVFFDDLAVTNACSPDENNCYRDTNCTLSAQSAPGVGKTATGTDALLTADCQVTVWFNANASDFDVQAQATDDNGVTDFADAGVALTNLPLEGIDVAGTGMAYGSLAINETSQAVETSIGNAGNQVIDVLVEGDNMCTDYPTCTGYVIAFSEQKWHHTTGSFSWDATETDPGPWRLVDLAGIGPEPSGCINRDIAVRDEHDSTLTNESIYWKIRILGASPGSYTGANTFTATGGGSCTGTLH